MCLRQHARPQVSVPGEGLGANGFIPCIRKPMWLSEGGCVGGGVGTNGQSHPGMSKESPPKILSTFFSLTTSVISLPPIYLSPGSPTPLAGRTSPN